MGTRRTNRWTPRTTRRRRLSRRQPPPPPNLLQTRAPPKSPRNPNPLPQRKRVQRNLLSPMARSRLRANLRRLLRKPPRYHPPPQPHPPRRDQDEIIHQINQPKLNRQVLRLYDYNLFRTAFFI